MIKLLPEREDLIIWFDVEQCRVFVVDWDKEWEIHIIDEQDETVLRKYIEIDDCATKDGYSFEFQNTYAIIAKFFDEYWYNQEIYQDLIEIFNR